MNNKGIINQLNDIVKMRSDSYYIRTQTDKQDKTGKQKTEDNCDSTTIKQKITVQSRGSQIDVRDKTICEG